jgi:putative transposase
MPGIISTESPLAVVEVDHSPLDIQLVSSDTRVAIGRAYLTLVSDSFSRAVLGFNLGLDPPGSLTVALALTHAVMPKEEWLAERGLLDIEWPMYGLMRSLRLDNAAEFHSHTFESACSTWGIAVHFRKKKEDGGIIERLIGTIQAWASQEPGATGSDPKKTRGEKPTQAFAQMTIAEAETWIANTICSKYHRVRHSALGVAPLQAWRAWHLDGESSRLPTSVTSKKAFLTSFLPSRMRTIGPSGVRLFNERYFNSELRTLVQPGVSRRIHYDPRRMGTIFVEAPTGFVEVGYADTTKECLPKFEIDHIRRQIKAGNPNLFDQHARVAHVLKMRKERDLGRKSLAAARRRERLYQAGLVAKRKPANNLDHAIPDASSDNVNYALAPTVGTEGPV